MTTLTTIIVLTPTRKKWPQQVPILGANYRVRVTYLILTRLVPSRKKLVTLRRSLVVSFSTWLQWQVLPWLRVSLGSRTRMCICSETFSILAFWLSLLHFQPELLIFGMRVSRNKSTIAWILRALIESMTATSTTGTEGSIFWRHSSTVCSWFLSLSLIGWRPFTIWWSTGRPRSMTLLSYLRLMVTRLTNQRVEDLSQCLRSSESWCLALTFGWRQERSHFIPTCRSTGWDGRKGEDQLPRSSCYKSNHGMASWWTCTLFIYLCFAPYWRV